jgi:hypothetical protein
MAPSTEPRFDRLPLVRAIDRARRALSIATSRLVACECRVCSERTHRPRKVLVTALGTLRRDPSQRELREIVHAGGDVDER